MKTFLFVSLPQILAASFLLADSTTPPTASFGASSITVSQTAGEVRIPVNLSGPALSDFFGTTVSFVTGDGTAKWPNDFDTRNGSVKFVSGVTSKVLIIGITSTPAFVGTRSFTVRLGNSGEYQNGTPSLIKVNITGAIPAPRPKIRTSTQYLSGGRVSVTITATDANGATTTKRLIVKPKAKK